MQTQTTPEEMFDEMIDESYPVFKIGHAEFYPSQILKNCDPILYRLAVEEYHDMMEEEND
jgi:hypothetical protein